MNTDRLTVQMVVAFIGLLSLIIAGGLIFLSYQGREIPEQLSTMGGATIGVLGSLLARTSTNERRSSSEDVLPVEVKNSTDSPIPVAQTESDQQD